MNPTIFGSIADDRILSTDCARFVGGKCNADPPHAVVDQPVRCHDFVPKAGLDRRSGSTRWPHLVITELPADEKRFARALAISEGRG